MQHCLEAQRNYFEGDNLQHTWTLIQYSLWRQSSYLIATPHSLLLDRSATVPSQTEISFFKKFIWILLSGM
jgi:hypothetical protein